MTLQPQLHPTRPVGSAQIKIRRVQPHEYDAVGELTMAAYVTEYEGLNDSYVDSLGQVAPRAEQHQVWVAVDAVSGELLGTVTTPQPGERLGDYAQPHEMDFRMLAVGTNARGRGVGSALVAHCAEVAQERGARGLVLHTGDTMAAAVALYERLGFSRATEVEANFPYPPGVWYAVRVYAKPLDVG